MTASKDVVIIKGVVFDTLDELPWLLYNPACFGGN